MTIDSRSLSTNLFSSLLRSRLRAFLSQTCSPMTCSTTTKMITYQWFYTNPSLTHSFNTDLTLLRTSIPRPAILTFLPWPMPWAYVCKTPISFSMNPPSFPPTSLVFTLWYALPSSSKRINYLVSQLLHLNLFC